MKKLVIILLGLLLSLILIEGFLRFGGFIYSSIYKTPQPKDSSDLRIFCVGESTTWGMGASNPLLKGYPKQLEEILNKQIPNRKINCFFDRTIGQNTSEILDKIPNYIKKYKPHIIIFMLGINNWWNLDKSNILLFNKNELISKSTLKTLVFLDRFRVWKLFKWLAYSWGFKKERWNYRRLSFNQNELGEFIDQVHEKYYFEIFADLAEKDIVEMLKLCRRNKVKAIVCSYPRNAMVELYRAHKSISIRFRVPFVDLQNHFDKLPNIEEYFSDKVHPNDKGYKIVAQRISQCILENKLIE